MTTLDFILKEFPDGRLMSLIIFREGKNFRIHKGKDGTYYSWCYHEDDLNMALKVYRAVSRFNTELFKKLNEGQKAIKKSFNLKRFYT